MSLLSRQSFASFLRYSVRGDSELSRKSRDARLDLKNNKVIASLGITNAQYIALRLTEEFQKEDEEFENPELRRKLRLLETVLSPTAALVPVPRSSLIGPDSLWPPFELATALVDQGLGGQVLPILKRTRAVPKAAFAAPGERSSAQDHFETIAVDQDQEVPRTLILVDDIITTGASILGTASLLRRSWPTAEIRAFLAYLPLSFGEVESIVDPQIGSIQLRPDGSTSRTP
ncbi:MAG: phosphoribosyltransferase [Acidobacteriota bacterium]